MVEMNQIYVCEKCGLIVRPLSDSDEAPQHCELPMKETDPEQQVRWRNTIQTNR